MNAAPHDPVDRALAVLCARAGAAHGDHGGLGLRLQLAHGGAHRRTWRGTARGATVVVTVLALGGVAAAALGFDRVRAWLGLEILEVDRGRDGVPAVIRARDAGGEMLLVPLERSEGTFDPTIHHDAPAQDLPTPDGGAISLRMLREGRALCAEFWRSDPTLGDPRPGDRLVVVRVLRTALLAERRDGELRLLQRYDDGSEETIVLRPVPDLPACFGDGETLVEVPAR